eukprot:s593_g18.t1
MPRPLRDAERVLGRRYLKPRELRQLEQGTLFFFQVLITLGWSLITGALYLSEHPATPILQEAASVWKTPWILLLCMHPEVKLHTISQWRWGCTVSKPTGLLAMRLPKFNQSMYSRQAPDARYPTEVAIGLGPDGQFKTSSHKEYPEQLCDALAGTIDKSTGHVTDVVAWNQPLKKAGLLVDIGQGKSEEVLGEHGAVFPLDLYSKGYRVAVHKSEASLEADRKRILHFLASTPADSWDRLKPPTDKEAYSTVNASLQQRFIAGAMAASAMADDEKTLKKIVTDHPEILESCTAHGFRPVHAAAMKGKLQALKLLVGLQCNVNARATDGRTPLHVAAREGHDATVLYLLKNKAEVDATSDGGKTALHASIEGGHITIAGSLLDHKADPNISAGAEPPLLLAARDDQAATCGLLLDFKADPSKESADGKKCYELVKHSTKLVDTLKKAAQDTLGGGGSRSTRRRPSVGEERMVVWTGILGGPRSQCDLQQGGQGFQDSTLSKTFRPQWANVPAFRSGDLNENSD